MIQFIFMQPLAPIICNAIAQALNYTGIWSNLSQSIHPKDSVTFAFTLCLFDFLKSFHFFEIICRERPLESFCQWQVWLGAFASMPQTSSTTNLRVMSRYDTFRMNNQPFLTRHLLYLPQSFLSAYAALSTIFASLKPSILYTFYTFLSLLRRKESNTSLPKLENDDEKGNKP